MSKKEMICMKENIINLITNPQITPEKIAETFAISKVDYNKMAEEICDYFSYNYCENKTYEHNFEALVNAYYDTVIRVFDKTICRIYELQPENKNKFSEIYNAKLRIDKMLYNYFEVYISDYSYHDVAFLSNQKEEIISDKKNLFYSTLCKKLCEFVADENLQSVVYNRDKAIESIEGRKQELHIDFPDAEYHKVLACDEIVKQLESEISCYGKAIDAFLFIKNFEESFENNINKEDEEIYRKVYIKRRIHQFTFKKEEMYQYFIRPYLSFDENTSLVREIYEDIGHFIPTHGGNMKKLFFAYFDLCVYELNKNVFSLCSLSQESSDKNKAVVLKDTRIYTEKLSKALHEIYFCFVHNYGDDEKASDLVYENFNNLISEFNTCFDHKIQMFFPEIKRLYEKIDELYASVEHTDNDFPFFGRKPNPHNDAIYSEIKSIKNSITEFVKSLPESGNENA